MNDVLRTIAADPRRRSTVWAATAQHGVYKSTDAGASWSPSLPRRPGFDGITHDLAVDPRRPAVVYAATSAGVFKTANGGREWKAEERGAPPQRGPGRGGRPGPAYAFFKTTGSGGSWTRSASPSGTAAPDGTLYAYSNYRGLFTSRDGVHWTQLAPPLPPAADSERLILDPDDPETIYAASGYGVQVFTTHDPF